MEALLINEAVRGGGAQDRTCPKVTCLFATADRVTMATGYTLAKRGALLVAVTVCICTAHQCTQPCEQISILNVIQIPILLIMQIPILLLMQITILLLIQIPILTPIQITLIVQIVLQNKTFMLGQYLQFSV